SLSLGGCEGSDATAFGQVTVAARRPAFEGPIRFGRLTCPAQGAEVQSAAVLLLVRADEALAAFEGRAALRSGAAIFGDSRITALAGDSRFTWRDSGLTARYDLHGADFTAPPAAVAQLEIDGALRARRNFERVELDAA